ncbi:MAG: arsenate reductase (glutaredoxin) [Vicingaceae bacterium]
MKIYHNPRCSKSRQALNLLKEKGVTPEVVEYLKEVPTFEEMKKLVQQLNMKPEDILRKGEEIYKKEFKGKNFTDDEWIKILIENPKLIERPIIVKGNKAIVGRPPEKVLELI